MITYSTSARQMCDHRYHRNDYIHRNMYTPNMCMRDCVCTHIHTCTIYKQIFIHMYMYICVACIYVMWRHLAQSTSVLARRSFLKSQTYHFFIWNLVCLLNFGLAGVLQSGNGCETKPKKEQEREMAWKQKNQRRDRREHESDGMRIPCKSFSYANEYLKLQLFTHICMHCLHIWVHAFVRICVHGYIDDPKIPTSVYCSLTSNSEFRMRVSLGAYSTAISTSCVGTHPYRI